MGKVVARVGDYDTGTSGVDHYAHKMHGQLFNIWDTRGFNDLAMRNTDIINLITSRVTGKVHVVLICFDISKSRITSADIDLESRIFEAMSAGAIGGKPVVVFTKANKNPRAEAVAKQRLEVLKHAARVSNVVSDISPASIAAIWHQMDSGLVEFDFSQRRKLCAARQTVQLKPLPKYPAHTTQRIIDTYNSCIERKRLQSNNNLATGGLFGLLAFTLFGIATGGAGFLGAAATLGGGSLAAGGAGVAGGLIMATALGMAAGGIMGMSNTDCRNHALDRVDINARHVDFALIGQDALYIYVDGVKCDQWGPLQPRAKITGDWLNNAPIGAHVTAGVNFTMVAGVLTHYPTVILKGVRIDCDWRMD
jgi:hypothetical protein